jgi:hypothetical protein
MLLAGNRARRGSLPIQLKPIEACEAGGKDIKAEVFDPLGSLATFVAGQIR